VRSSAYLGTTKLRKAIQYQLSYNTVILSTHRFKKNQQQQQQLQYNKKLIVQKSTTTTTTTTTTKTRTKQST
jgi:hypothetical protein